MNKRFNKSRSLLTAAMAVTVLSLPAQQFPAQPSGRMAGSPDRQVPQVYEFSLRQAIDYMSKNSVFVKNALLDYQIQEQSNRATTSQALPQVTGNLGLTDFIQIPTTLIPGEFLQQPAGTFVPVQFGTQWNATGGVTLKQVLFDGQVFVGLQARRSSLDFYLKKQEVTEQVLRANITKIYYSLLISRTQIDQIDANISSQKELQHNSSEMFKNGFAEQLDVDKSTVQLSNLESEKIQVEFSIANGYLGLKMLMGMPVNDSLRLTDTVTYDMIRDATLSDNYKYTDRKDYQLMEIGRTLNEFNVKRYKEGYIPTANFTANYSQNQYANEFDLGKRNSWFPTTYIGLSINIPIFDGFFKDANIKQAKLQLRQSENNIDSLKLRIDNDVRQAQLRFAAALSTLDFQKKNMDLSERVYMQTRKKYEQGLGSNTEITTALSDQKTAQANYFNALYNAIAARVDYLNAIGKL
ncbi:MAG TPA: TolC family protein [Puia sp.]|nr:TolC family protein [Puia sp.]